MGKLNKILPFQDYFYQKKHLDRPKKRGVVFVLWSLSVVATLTSQHLTTQVGFGDNSEEDQRRNSLQWTKTPRCCNSKHDSKRCECKSGITTQGAFCMRRDRLPKPQIQGPKQPPTGPAQHQPCYTFCWTNARLW